MGYPSWRRFAEAALAAAKGDHPGADVEAAQAALKRADYPSVFEDTSRLLGGPRLRQVLSGYLVPSGDGRIYDLLARWPVPVYLTTNFEDALQGRLAALGEHYVNYGNSADHLAHLTPGLTGAIFKLHGDLRSDVGLILTRTQYDAIATGPEWQHWRTKLTSVFQMNPIIVIGYSLSDPHVRHILQAAQSGAGVAMPVCWITADATIQQTRDYLERFRIRLIPYDNRDGSHKNLRRLVEQINQFVPPRTSVGLSPAFARATESPLGADAAAPGFFVFNKLAARAEHENERCAVLLAALQATTGELAKAPEFSLEEALRMAGWPEASALELTLAKELTKVAIEKGLFEPAHDGLLRVAGGASRIVEGAHQAFEHVRERFQKSLELRARRLFPDLTEAEASTLATDLDASLTAYFRHGGLTLATALLAGAPSGGASLPSSIVEFITEASTRYNDLLKRQAFCAVSVDAFVNAQSAEREYLGRVAQGFFAFHSLGVFGEVAQERLHVAKDTVWLLDSNLLIPALAIKAPTNEGTRATIAHLKGCGLRLFATETLFDEAWGHLTFARRLVKERGPDSPDVIAAATGQTPYRKTNQFLQGFLAWRAAGGRSDWEAYLFECFGKRAPAEADVREVLRRLGVDVVQLQDWPGFDVLHFETRDRCSEKIATERERGLGGPPTAAEREEFLQKAKPEAEALLVVRNERAGKYFVLSEPGKGSQAWFISDTAILNSIEPGLRITWQPEAFLRFAATLAPASPSMDAFGTVLWAVAEAGVSLVDEQTVETVFGGLIDAAKLKLEEQRQLYEETLARKYGESPSAVLRRLPPSAQPLAALQLTQEMLTIESGRRRAAEAQAKAEKRRGDAAQRELGELSRLKRKLDRKHAARRPGKKKRR